ncbi:MAG TPA: ABC transporter permease, partial [Vicinamibacteria bacterium]|nr:ABC transporter permease [Vicinamibacteria bacterium]
LGIGANTAIFSVASALLLRSLPVQRPEELLLFGDARTAGFVGYAYGQRYDIFSYPLYLRLRDAAGFRGVAAFRSELDRMAVRRQGRGGEPQLAWARLVSGNYFSVLGVPASVGRVLGPSDDRLSAAPAAVISDGCWQRRFNRDPSVVGGTLEARGMVFTVVGVAPPGFTGESVEPTVPDLWMPVTLQPRLMPDRGSVLERDDVNWLYLLGRTAPGANQAAAQAAVDTILRQFQIDQAGPGAPDATLAKIRRSSVVLTPGGRGVSHLRQDYACALHVLVAVVALVLLIACANVANLLLSRTLGRDREISVRMALGAGKGALVRQLLAESALLGLGGGALGVLLADWSVKALATMVLGASAAAGLDTTPDLAVVGFTLGLSLATGLVVGLGSAWRASRLDFSAALKSSRAGSEPGRRWRLARGLVVAQVAVSLLLLVGAGLFVRTLRNLRRQDLGFDTAHVIEAAIEPRLASYEPGRLPALYDALLVRANALPGVRAASLSLYSPVSGTNWSGQISVEGYLPPPGRPADCQWVWVGPRYLETAGIPLLLGRDLVSRDVRGAPKVAVVNEAFVRAYLGGGQAVGRRFSMDVPARSYEVEIVGVMRDSKFNQPRQERWPVAFLPLAQADGPTAYAGYLEVRATGEPSALGGSLRRLIREVDAGLPVTTVRPLREQVDEALGTERMVASLSGAFSLLALLLACIGLQGVLAYAVGRRTSEIGIRMALGARQGGILWMVLREAWLLVGGGIAIGAVAAIAATRLVKSQLYEVGATDPATVGAAIVALFAVATMAALVPARKASRVDPVVALRRE